MSVKSNTTPNHHTGCKTNVAMHNATVQQPLTTVSPNSNPTIKMLPAEAGFVIKHYAVPLHRTCPPFIPPLVEQTPVVSNQRLWYNEMAAIGPFNPSFPTTSSGFRITVAWFHPASWPISLKDN
ncbi:hypothetical protein TNCV_5039161 [Trichonephila clavipes]|nr:hypothetical protein TNCV_5039161 [Trichonephila clavipes]